MQIFVKTQDGTFPFFDKTVIMSVRVCRVYILSSLELSLLAQCKAHKRIQLKQIQRQQIAPHPSTHGIRTNPKGMSVFC